MATKYIDMELGNNKPALTVAYAFNPSGTITRIFGNGIEHGLTTGDQVSLTYFSAWLNGTWTVTVYDKYSFDLDGAVWETTSDFYGRSTPLTANANDGSSWALATKGEMNVSTGDTVLVAKTPDPVSLGQNVTFTNKSNLLELTTAVTQDVDQANVNNWVAANGNSVGLLTSAAYKKLGSGVIQITKKNTFTTTGKLAYKTLPAALDLSGYTKISFWHGASSQLQQYQCGLKICLCSDTLGDTIVDEFMIPAVSLHNVMDAFVLTNGVALGNNINSVAVYTTFESSAAPQLRFNHIFACNDVTLNTLISKTDTIFSEQLAIQSITGTEIIIDGGIYASSRGYYGTTETVNAYIREALPCSKSSTITLDTRDGFVSLLFGVNKTTDEQDGETWLSNCNVTTSGTVNNNKPEYEISNAGFLRAKAYSMIGYGKIKNIQATAFLTTTNIIYLNSVYSFKNVRANNNTCTSAHGEVIKTRALNTFVVNKKIYSNSNTGSYIQGMAIQSNDCYYEDIQCCNNSHFGLMFATADPYQVSFIFSQGNYFLNIEAIENSNTDLVVFTGENTFNNLTASNTRINAKTYLVNSDLQENIYNYNVHQLSIGGVLGVNRVNVANGEQTGGYAEWQTEVKQGNDTGAWACYHPFAFLRLAEIAVKKDIQITIRAWFSNRNFGDEGLLSKLIVRKRNNPNVISEDVSTHIQPYALTWQEISVTFTPIETGVIVLEFYQETTGTTPIFIGSISMT